MDEIQSIMVQKGLTEEDWEDSDNWQRKSCEFIQAQENRYIVQPAK